MDRNEDIDEIAGGGWNGLRQPEPTLPSLWYHDPAHHEAELQAIWYRQWVYLCREDALAGPLAFRVFDIGSQQILVLRDEEGGLKAFHNTCRHRGAALCQEAAGKLKTRRITCPYHAWTYDLAGALVGVPTYGRRLQIDPRDYALYDVKLISWRGFVFVSLAEGEAPPFFPFFDEELNRLAHWPLEDLVVGHTHTRIIQANWKIFWENYNECLHCPGVHPSLSRMVPIYARGIQGEQDDPDWRAHAAETDPKYKGGLRQGAATWSKDGRSSGHEFPALDDEDRRTGFSYITCLPSMYLAAHVDYVRSVRLRPLGPEVTELYAEWLLPRETLDDPAFDIRNMVEFGLEFMEEDAGVCELNQRGIRSTRHVQGTLMPEEYHVHRFQNWVRAQLA